MDTLQSILSNFKSIQEKNKHLNYQETLIVFKALKQISVEQNIIDKFIRLINFSEENSQIIKNLSRREVEIFKLVGLGLSSREISETLSIHESTVSTHRKHIIKKLEISGVGQLHKEAYQYLQSQL